jgi:CubicO group peptidase (beta-lactamase class C family)
VSTLQDMLALLSTCQPESDGPQLLKPATLQLITRNQLPDGLWQRFSGMPAVPGKGYGLAGAVTLWPSPTDHPAAASEVCWGGVGGTQWLLNPRHRLAAVLMTQRKMSFMHPFAFDWKRAVYEAAAARP